MKDAQQSADVGACILTASGSYFCLDQPQNARISIEDIAHALSHICRFTGHTNTFYSVAQHSVLVSTIVPEEDALAALLDDAAEAFLGDVSTPLKSLLPEYVRIERGVKEAVLKRFGIKSIPDSVRQADLVALATERRDLMDHGKGLECSVLKGIKPLSSRIMPLPPRCARREFLDRFYALTCRLRNEILTVPMTVPISQRYPWNSRRA